MPKWRPSIKNCLYVIPDIHGNAKILKMILKQILPLRKSDGGKDKLIFLGDYIDRNVNSPEVIDILIAIKNAYPNQVNFLMGNHEQMLLKAFNRFPSKSCTLQDRKISYRTWMNNGGYSTIEGYMEKFGMDPKTTLPSDLPEFRVEQIIPEIHWKFFEELELYHAYDEFLFVNAGCDPYVDIEKQDPEVLLWDRGLCKQFANSSEFSWVQWEHVIVTGHNASLGVVFHPKFLMLDAGSPERLLCVELNSKKAVMAFPEYKRLIKVNIDKL